MAQFLTLFGPADHEKLTKLWHKLRRMRPRDRRRFRWAGEEEEEEAQLRASYRHLNKRRGGGYKVTVEITSSDDEVVEVEEVEVIAVVKKEVPAGEEVVKRELPEKAVKRELSQKVVKAEVQANLKAEVKLEEVKTEVNAEQPRGKKSSCSWAHSFSKQSAVETSCPTISSWWKMQ